MLKNAGVIEREDSCRVQKEVEMVRRRAVNRARCLESENMVSRD